MASRSRRITRPNGEIVGSYDELNSTHLPRSSHVRKTKETWSAGLYPVEVIDEGEEGYVKVHYLGWNRKHDKKVPADQIVRIPHQTSSFAHQLAITIKENLTPGKCDSLVKVKVPVTEEEFGQISNSGTPYKITRTKTVFRISSRNRLNILLGEGWDYRILNEEGDNFYVKTATVKFYLHTRKPLNDFLVYPDHIERYALDRGMQLVFSFVKMASNNNNHQKLLNANEL
ncbi:uncharacterized protein LOC110446631 [Mizuhopecten yessoensis]|nr:uncharacterized protein LOC110446631 [Mizuhopecten yessoensis]